MTLHQVTLSAVQDEITVGSPGFPLIDFLEECLEGWHKREEFRAFERSIAHAFFKYLNLNIFAFKGKYLYIFYFLYLKRELFIT